MPIILSFKCSNHNFYAFWCPPANREGVLKQTLSKRYKKKKRCIASCCTFLGKPMWIDMHVSKWKVKFIQKFKETFQSETSFSVDMMFPELLNLRQEQEMVHFGKEMWEGFISFHRKHSMSLKVPDKNQLMRTR